MAANVSSYISAGNAAIKNAYQSLAAARDNSPKHGELARKGMRARAKENIAAMQANTKVQTTKEKAEAHVKQYGIAAEGLKKVTEIKKGQQMAGKLASAAGMIALSSMPGPEQLKPRSTDYSRSEALYRERLGQAESDIKKFEDPNYRSELDKEFEALETGGGVNRSLENVDSATGAGAPVSTSNTLQPGGSNVFVTGSTGRGTGPHLHASVWDTSKGQYINPTGLYEQYITGPDGQPLSSYRMSSGYGHRHAPVAGASTNHKGVDWGIGEGTRLNIGLQELQGAYGRRYDQGGGGGWMTGYQIPDSSYELHLMHGQQLPGE